MSVFPVRPISESKYFFHQVANVFLLRIYIVAIQNVNIFPLALKSDEKCQFIVRRMWYAGMFRDKPWINWHFSRQWQLMLAYSTVWLFYQNFPLLTTINFPFYRMWSKITQKGVKIGAWYAKRSVWNRSSKLIKLNHVISKRQSCSP